MDKLKYIKLENEDGSYSDSIPLAVDSDHVDVNGDTLTNKIRSLATKDETSVLQSEISSLASGSPAGAYATVAELTSADPDHSKIYVVIADGKWYYYNGNSWSAGGDYQIPLSSDDNYDIDMFKNFISLLEKTNDLNKEELNDIEWIEGYYYNKQNVLTEYNYSKCCELAVISGDMWQLDAYTPPDAYAWFLLDVNDNIIKHSERGESVDTIIIPTNAVKMKVNFFLNRPQGISKMTSFLMNFEATKILLNRMGMDLLKRDLLYGASYSNNKIWSSGNLVTFSGYQASEKIEIPKGTAKLFLPTSHPTNLISFFDENKNFLVEKQGITSTAPDKPMIIDLTEEAYAEVKYFGITIWKDNPITQQVSVQDGNSPWKIIVSDEPIQDDSIKVDLFMFMGQSNMCGQGNPTLAPALIEGAGWEYRASSNTIFPISEPFGAVDNGETRGSLATAFANAYYLSTGIPIIGCMCAVSGSGIDEWQPDTTYLNRAVSRLESCKTYLTTNNYKIRNINMLWLQGEHEGMRNGSAESYKQSFNNLFTVMKSHGVKNAFIIRIGEHNVASGADFSTIIKAQTEMCQDNKDIIMATTTLCSMADRDLMNDEWHFNQIALNEAGDYSGRNVAYFLTTGKEPTMYDYKYDDLYYSKTN